MEGEAGEKRTPATNRRRGRLAAELRGGGDVETAAATAAAAAAAPAPEPSASPAAAAPVAPRAELCGVPQRDVVRSAGHSGG